MNKNIFITGVAGFIGSSLTSTLSESRLHFNDTTATSVSGSMISGDFKKF